MDGEPLQMPTLKFLTSPAPCSLIPGHDFGNRIKLLFNMFSIFFIFVRSHTKFGIKIFEISMLMIFDLLTSPKVTSLTIGLKCNLHCVLLVMPVDLTCYMTMFEKYECLTPWIPPVPQSPAPGA